MIRSLLGIVLLAAVPALAQHDISQVEPAPPDSAISTPTPNTRGWRKYDVADLDGARQVIGPQLLNGRLRKPIVDFIAQEGEVEQRISIFEEGLVVVNMTGSVTIRKKLIIPEHALKSYLQVVSPEALGKIDESTLVRPDRTQRSVLRVYAVDGSHVERTFNPTRMQSKDLNDQIAPLRDLLRAVSEDRHVTSSVAGYEPKAGDELVADDQKVYRVMRVVDGAGVVELKCLDAPTTIYVTKQDLHLYFIGAKPR